MRGKSITVIDNVRLREQVTQSDNTRPREGG